MGHSIASIEWKAQETTRNRSTESVGEDASEGYSEVFLVPRPELSSSWDGAMRYAVQRSGMDQYEVADEMSVSHGHMSKVMRGTGGFYGPRLVRFMRTTRSLAPLQWLAHEMGCDLVPRSIAAAEIAALRTRLRELEGPRS